jgi:Niemann-Pick C1 protein
LRISIILWHRFVCERRTNQIGDEEIMRRIISSSLLLLILFVGYGVEAKQSAGYCAMYDICGARSDGKVLNCPFNIPSVKPDDLLSSKIQSLCPTITGNVCCTETQFDTLRSQVQQAIPFIVGCPACLRNFLNLFCELTCSPDQSLFINVTSTTKVKNNSTVDGIQYYITDDFGAGMYESCKNVKFGSSNSRALDFLGAGAKNFKEWFTFIGQKAGVNLPGSPYGIAFLPTPPVSSGMRPMNVSIYSCGDESLGCSCGDCPSAATCSSKAEVPTQKKHSCSIKIGSLEVKCVDFILAILYIVLVSLFLGGGLLHPVRGKKKTSQMGTLSEASGERNSVNQQKPDTIQSQMLQNTPQRNWGQLSTVQGHLANFYGKYGIWVARHPTLVLCLSVSVVLLLCVGLIRFKVETRPDKLWVGSGSRAAEEKQFFDTHLAPFYRIEQLIIATVQTSSHEKAPEILTDDNIKLLFDIQKKVDGLRANHSGSMVSLTDICMKPLGEDCATQSVLQYFKMKPENYDDYGGVDHVKYCFEVTSLRNISRLTDSYLLLDKKQIHTCIPQF